MAIIKIGLDIDGSMSSVLSVNGVLPVLGNVLIDTDDIGEGPTNLYFTDERVDDRVAALLVEGAGIDLTYNDPANTLTVASTITQYTNEMVDDQVALLIQNGTGITWAYDDNLNTLTPTVTVTGYTDEQAQDAVGTILVDSSKIDFTYSDATPSITATIVAGSLDETDMDASVNASLDLADSSVQLAFRTIAVSGQSDIVADSATDTLTLVAGTNISITTDAGADSVTINNLKQQGSFIVASTTASTPQTTPTVGSISNLSAAPSATSGSGSVVTVTNSTAKIELTVNTTGFFEIWMLGNCDGASTSPNFDFQFYFNGVAMSRKCNMLLSNGWKIPIHAAGAGSITGGQLVELMWAQTNGTGAKSTIFENMIIHWIWSPT